jgi:valine dehydrogenase (NAD+)
LITAIPSIHGFDFDRARERAGRIFDTTRQILALADREGVSPDAAADRIAEDRIAAAA